MKIQLSREVKIALLVIVTLAVAVWGFNYLKGIDIFTRHREFVAIYNRVDGLGISSPVQVNGLNVGAVSEITLMENRPGFILVKFRVSDGLLSIPIDSEAKIASSSLLGSKHIDIILGQSTQMAVSGDTLVTSIEEDLQTSVNKMVQPLKEKVERLISNVDSLLVPIQTILDEDGTKNLAESLARIPKILKSLETTVQRVDTLIANEKNKLGRIFSNVESITLNLKNNNEKITSILANVDNITDSLAQSNFKQTIANATSTIAKVDSIMQKINEGQGTLGMLINDPSLYNQLDSAAASIKNLITDINENPERYLHFSLIHINKKGSGRTPKQPKPTP